MTNGYSSSNIGGTNVRTPQPMGTPPQSRPNTYNMQPSKGYISLITIGVIIIMVGCLIWVSVGFLSPPNRYDDKYIEESEYGSSSPNDKYYEDSADYSNNVRVISTIGNIIQTIGVVLLALGLALGGLKDSELTANVRLGMIIAMGLIIAFKITTFVSTTALYSSIYSMMG